MTLLSFLVLLLVAGICGSVGESIVGYSRGGCLTSIFIGFIGAMLGMWLSSVLGIREFLAINIGGQPFPIVWSVIGATLFVLVLNQFRGPRYID